MSTSVSTSHKLLYAILFVLIIPVGLWLWARYTENIIGIPAVRSSYLGWILVALGGYLVLWAMYALWKYGKGLPMNISPPVVYVAKGPYRICKDPIYWGFGILTAGIFIIKGSASGLWLVTPITALGMIALVWGYEKIDLSERFPEEKSRSLLALPEQNSGLPSSSTRLISLFKILAILFAENYLFLKLDSNSVVSNVISRPAIQFEDSLFAGVILIIFVPMIIKRNDLLREWFLISMIALLLSGFITFLLPSLGTTYLPRMYLGASVWKSASAITVVPLFLIFLSLHAIYRQSKKRFFLFAILAAPVCFVDLYCSRSYFLSLAIAIVVFILSSNYYRIWSCLKFITELIANSWKEWTFWKIRIINHGFYAGFGAFLGILLSGIHAGKGHAWAILAFAVTVIIFSALWAQVIEGSEKLKRPYGYYGALVGILFASIVVKLMGYNYWTIIGVVSVFMPWVQAIGRLRCLVNGCCHGKPTEDPHIGIRYFHPRSRVCGLSGYKGTLLHPTPLYSIIWLFFVGFVLLSLWYHSFSPGFIFGIYLILTGIGRFVEEAYRGEVQTPIIKGLRLYQWTAILSVIAGIIMTTIPVKPVIISQSFDWEVIISALLGGLFTTFAMGVDFPYSNARFSRLV